MKATYVYDLKHVSRNYKIIFVKHRKVGDNKSNTERLMKHL